MSFYDDYIADGLYDPETEEWNLDGLEIKGKAKTKKEQSLPRNFTPISIKPTKHEFKKVAHLVFIVFANGQLSTRVTVGAGLIGTKTFKQIIDDLDFKPTHYDIIEL